MPSKIPLLQTLSLKGLEIAPSQVWGSVRIVPLLRSQPRSDLRLFKRNYNSDLTVVSIDKNISYISYVPHALVLHWSKDGRPVASLGGQLLTSRQQHNHGPSGLQVLHRMAKRESKNALRLLPLHLAMEGFLGMFFNGPEIAWSSYSKQALSTGLSPRIESALEGRDLPHLETALRIFEIHENQVGVLLFVSEQLASAFVVPTAEDYRRLHSSLLEDFYGEMFYNYGLYGATSDLAPPLDANSIQSLDDLESALYKMRSDWAQFQGFMASDLLGRSLDSKRVYTAGPFSLQRFMTDLSPSQQNYIGEAIADDQSQLQYLKIYGLSAIQTRRAFLLQRLAANHWNIERTAEEQGDRLDAFVYRIEKAGFGYLLNNQLRETSQKARRKLQSKQG